MHPKALSTGQGLLRRDDGWQTGNSHRGLLNATPHLWLKLILHSCFHCVLQFKKNQLCMVAQTFNPSTGEAEVGRSLGVLG